MHGRLHVLHQVAAGATAHDRSRFEPGAGAGRNHQPAPVRRRGSACRSGTGIGDRGHCGQSAPSGSLFTAQQKHLESRVLDLCTGCIVSGLQLWRAAHSAQLLMRCGAAPGAPASRPWPGPPTLDCGGEKAGAHGAGRPRCRPPDRQPPEPGSCPGSSRSSCLPRGSPAPPGRPWSLPSLGGLA